LGIPTRLIAAFVFRYHPLSRKYITTEDLIVAVHRSRNGSSSWIGAHVELLRHDREWIPYDLGDVVSTVPELWQAPKGTSFGMFSSGTGVYSGFLIHLYA